MLHKASTRRGLRRVAVTGMSTVLLTGAAPALTAAAAAPLREVQSEVHVTECTTSEDSGLRVELSVSWADYRNSDPAIRVVTADGTTVAYERFEDAFAVTWDGSVLSGQVTLLAAEPEPTTADVDGPGDGDPPAAEVYGTASFALRVAADGEPTETTERYHDGNTAGRLFVERQPMVVTAGTVGVTPVDGAELAFDPTGCTGSSNTGVGFVTQPDTSVTRPAGQVDAVCQATNEDGVLNVDLDSHGDGADVWLSAIPHEGPAVFGVAQPEWSGLPQPMQASAQMALWTGEDVVDAGIATIDLTTRKTGQTRYSMVFQGGRDTVATTFFALEGTVAVDGFAPFVLSECEGLAQTALNRRSSPSGSGSNGPAPGNDDLSSAAPLEIGAPGRNVQTGSTAEATELPMSCPDEWSGGFVGHTVWYAVTGTGEPVTVSPAGSSFNTVVAAYAADGSDGLVEVGCADDLVGDPHAATTQASVTFDTQAGRTYYVQIGGFANQTGRLKVAATA